MSRSQKHLSLSPKLSKTGSSIVSPKQAQLSFNRSSIFDKPNGPSVGFGGVNKPHFDLNPLYTSFDYKYKNLKPVPPPTDKIKACFPIYYDNLGYDGANRTYGRASGFGLLVNYNLCLTAHSVIPDERIATSSYAIFRDGDIYRFNPLRCFITSSKYEFTILAFEKHDNLVYKFPIKITELFTLYQDDPVYYFPFNYYQTVKVTQIAKNSFTFTTGKKEEILVGTPIFNTEWKLQGIYLRSSSYLNLAVRMEAIFSYMETNLNLFYNKYLTEFLRIDQFEYAEMYHYKFTYYFEWGGREIWKYNMELGEWNHVTIRSIHDLGQNWSFSWDHRIVYMPDSSIIVIGGKNSRDVIKFSPHKYHALSRLPSLISPREAPACLHVNNAIFALGGRPNGSTCEMYTINNKRWRPIPSMFYERSDSAICTTPSKTYIYVFGGQKSTGRTIERFHIKQGYWELLSVTLPRPLSKSCVYPVNDSLILILGGLGSHWVYKFNILELYESGLNELTGQGHSFIIEDCEQTLSEVTESVHPCAINKHSLFVLNSARKGFSTVAPGIVSFNLELL